MKLKFCDQDSIDWPDSYIVRQMLKRSLVEYICCASIFCVVANLSNLSLHICMYLSLIFTSVLQLETRQNKNQNSLNESNEIT